MTKKNRTRIFTDLADKIGLKIMIYGFNLDRIHASMNDKIAHSEESARQRRDIIRIKSAQLA
jgi:hypothetical protein